MSIREFALVRSCQTGYVDDYFKVERISSSARLDRGLYLMVPVLSDQEAWELQKRLEDKSKESQTI